MSQIPNFVAQESVVNTTIFMDILKHKFNNMVFTLYFLRLLFFWYYATFKQVFLQFILKNIYSNAKNIIICKAKAQHIKGLILRKLLFQNLSELKFLQQKKYKSWTPFEIQKWTLHSLRLRVKLYDMKINTLLLHITNSIGWKL